MKQLMLLFVLSLPSYLFAQNKYVQFDTTNIDYSIREGNYTINVTKDTITRDQANGKYSLVLKIKNRSNEIIKLPTYGTCWNDVMHISRFSRPENVAPGQTHLLPIKIMYGRHQGRKRVNKTSYIDILDVNGKQLDQIRVTLSAYIKDEPAAEKELERTVPFKK